MKNNFDERIISELLEDPMFADFTIEELEELLDDLSDIEL